MYINYNSFFLIYLSLFFVLFFVKEVVSIFLWMFLFVIRILNFNSIVSIFWYLIIRKDLCGYLCVYCIIVLLKLLVFVLFWVVKFFLFLSFILRVKNEYFFVLVILLV